MYFTECLGVVREVVGGVLEVFVGVNPHSGKSGVLQRPLAAARQ